MYLINLLICLYIMQIALAIIRLLPNREAALKPVINFCKRIILLLKQCRRYFSVKKVISIFCFFVLVSGCMCAYFYDRKRFEDEAITYLVSTYLEGDWLEDWQETQLKVLLISYHHRDPTQITGKTRAEIKAYIAEKGEAAQTLFNQISM